jgi:RNA polymerase sigma-70 factor (ECF subfamily)
MRIESLEPSDAVLVEAAQHGRLDSFGALYQRYHNPMVALAYAQLGDKHAAEDAAQEVFAVACRDLGSLRERDKFGPWLGGICRNVCRQMLRVRNRTAPLPGDPATPVARASRPYTSGDTPGETQPNEAKPARSGCGGMASLGDPNHGNSRLDARYKGETPSPREEPLGQVEQLEQWNAVRQAVWQLPTEERELIVMRYFDGFSQARISQVLDLTPAAVNGRLTRAKRKIAESLERSGFGSESWDA